MAHVVSPLTHSASRVDPDLLRQAAARAIAYLETLDDRTVTASPAALQGLAALETPLPEGPADPTETLRLLDEFGSPATTATAGGRYFGFVTGGSLPAALAAAWLAAAWDQNAGLSVMSPVATALEETARRWLLEALGLPPESGAGFVTGGTMANFTALAAARHAVLAQVGWDVEADGLFGAPPVTIVVGDEVHVSLLKALALLGFGRDRVIRVPVDGQGRLRPAALPAVSGPAIVCLQAGNVNTGAFDPLPAVAEVARARGAWLHVDGAFGLWARAGGAPALQAVAAGMDLADSWATDAHKWLNVPYDCGVAIVRDAEVHRAAMTSTAAYLVQTAGAERDAVDWVPEFSRRARGIPVYAALRALGRAGVADLVDRCCARARQFAEMLSAEPGVAILNEVVLNQALVRFDDDQTTRAVIAGVQADGTCWASGTTWHGQAAMRISVSNWATSEDDVALSVAAMLRVYRGLRGGAD